MTAALPVSRPAHVLVPPAHPFRPVFGQEIPIHVGDHHAPADVAHPVWERGPRRIAPGREPTYLAGSRNMPVVAAGPARAFRFAAPTIGARRPLAHRGR